MRRNNQVILDGQVNLKRVYRVQKSLAVMLEVTTDLPVMGGVHQVLANDDLALEVIAFAVTTLAHKEPLLATLYGWLWSGEQTHVVAERIDFHTRPELRSQSAGVLKHLRRDGLPAIVPVNGWRVSVPDVLGGVLDAGVVRQA